MSPALIAIMGPTASGKTALAEALADRLSARLINADAFQVYRGLDVGTGKSDRAREYALMDVVDPDETFTVGRWLDLAIPFLAKVYAARQSAVVVGGTGLYVRALFEDYSDLAAPPNPELRARLMRQERELGLSSLVAELRTRAPEVADKTDLDNPVRVRRALERLESTPRRLPALPPFARWKFVIDPGVEAITQRIAERYDAMVLGGWLNEVSGLLAREVPPSCPGMRAHGYRALAQVAQGDLSLDAVRDRTIAEIRRYAKRQRTWLRKEPGARRLEAVDVPSALEEVLAVLHNEGQ